MSQGPGEFLRLIRSGEATTRGELLAATGMSRISVAQRVDALLAAGVLRPAGDGGATGGRRSVRFVFEPRTVALVAALEVDSGLLAVVDAHGSVQARLDLDVHVADGPDATLRRVTDGFARLMAEHDVPAEQVIAIGVSVPGPIDPATGRLEEPPIMPGWGGWPITETLQEFLDVPVYVENDADAMAYGEWSRGRALPGRPLILVKASEYIGAGLVIDGKIYRGLDGGAGDIGHVPIGGERLCRCGRTGCLASEASGRAVLDRLAELGHGEVELTDLASRAEAGEPAVAATLRHAGEQIGRVLGSVAAVMNPAMIVIAGTLQSVTLVAAIRSAVYATALPRATRHLEITTDTLHRDCAPVGLARVAFDGEYAPAAVDARLENDS